MVQPFYQRLKAYFTDVGAVLQGRASSASIFPNTTDVGMSREQVYVEVLRQHLPSSCNVVLGGFVFDLDGGESNQIDVIITNDQSPRYDFHNPDGMGKAFACIDGCVAVAALKSRLTSAELTDALENIASLPEKQAIDNRVNPLIKIPRYEDWPVKLIFATDGVSLDTAQSTIANFYNSNPQIPTSKRPNLIHVAGKYVMVRAQVNARTRDGTEIPEGTFHGQIDQTDVFGLVWTVTEIHRTALASNHILYSYGEMLDHIEF